MGDQPFGQEWNIESETKKRKELTQEQREAGQTWIYPSSPESRYLIRDEPPSTTVLKQPETYATWLPIAGPERPYVAGDKPPRITDVTLIVAPPSVRAELQQREYEERVAKAEASRAFRGNIQQRLYGVQTKLAATETSLRELSLIQQQRAKGFEFVEKKGGQLYFAPKEQKGIAEAFLGIHVPSLPEILGYYVPTPPELLGFGRMEPEHYTMTEPLAGFVGAFEVPIYSVGRLAGFKTPRLPPSLLSGYSLEHPAYAAGAFAGEVVQAYFIGKGVEKGVSLTVKGVKKVSPYLVSGAKKAGTATFEKLIKPSVKYALGSERYSYYKSVAYPTFRQVTLPSYMETIKLGTEIYVKQPIGFFGKSVLGTEAYSFAKSVVLPNILQPQKVLGPTLSYWKGYLPSTSLPYVHKPLPISMLKSVYAPNILQLQKVVAPTLSYARQAYMPSLPSLPSFGLAKPLPISMLKSVYLPNITQLQKVVKPTLSLAYQQYVGVYPQLPSLSLHKPMWYLETKAFGKVAVGKASYTLSNVHLPSFSQTFGKPGWYLETKAYGKVAMGKTRYYLGLPTPAQTYMRASMRGLWLPQPEVTFKAEKLTGFTRRATGKGTVSLFAETTTKTATKLAVPIVPSLAFLPVKPKETKKKTENIMAAWTGATYPFMKEATMTKMKLPTYPTAKQFQRQTAYPKQKKKEKTKTEPLITPISLPSSTMLEKQTPKLRQPQIPELGQPQIFKQPQLQIPKQLQQQQMKMAKPLRLQLEMPKRPRKQRGLYGAWFPRTHQIKTAEQMMRTFTGRTTKKKGKKKKRKRRKK